MNIKMISKLFFRITKLGQQNKVFYKIRNIKFEVNLMSQKRSQNLQKIKLGGNVLKSD